MMPLKSISTFISRSIVFSLLLLMAAPVAQAQSSRSKAEWEKMRQKQIDDSIPLFRGVHRKSRWMESPVMEVQGVD